MSEDDRAVWDARYLERRAQSDYELSAPVSFFVDHASMLPENGQALDIGGGSGRNAVWLAGRGLTVTITDISTEGLATAVSVAETAGLRVVPLVLDLEHESLPSGPFDVVICSHFLVRDRLREVAGILGTGGVFLMTHPTVRNLERHPRPGRRFLLEEGELRTLLPGLSVHHYIEDWNADGRHEAEIIAVK